jgi:hypothetical protein
MYRSPLSPIKCGLCSCFFYKYIIAYPLKFQAYGKCGLTSIIVNHSVKAEKGRKD